MLEKYLIEHCAPTLASLKTASLFSYHAAQDPEDDVKHLNRIFRDKGVELLILKREENAMLIYVCRRTQLAKDLERPGAKELLERYGYTDTSVDGAIERLRMRLASGDGFPHEIGLFLGYPVDVGRCTATNARQCAHLRGIRSAGTSTSVCGRKAEVFCSLP